MKKCPECGNPSYDGAPVCGNCGYKFPVRKRVAPKKEAKIFDKTQAAKQRNKKPKQPKSLKKQTAESESTIQIIKDNKILIGIIVAVTVIAICGIVLSGSSHNNSTSGTGTDTLQFSEFGVSFSIPENWKQISLDDSDHPTAIFFDSGNDTVVEFYNITSGYSSLKDINQDRLTKAQNEGDYANTIETLTIDERNASNIILENANGDYTRYVSIFSDGILYVFKVTGSSINEVNSDSVNAMISSTHIE